MRRTSEGCVPISGVRGPAALKPCSCFHIAVIVVLIASVIPATVARILPVFLSLVWLWIVKDIRPLPVLLSTTGLERCERILEDSSGFIGSG